ncbi:hypothetical protein [Maritalea sp.]|uniref:hypothetical protein n=1 Tax=Maritalea sp. TaxID=2003361 RepID=UPI003EF5815E
MRSRTFKSIFAALLLSSSSLAMAAPACVLPETKISGERGIELGDQFTNYVKGTMSSKTQSLFAGMLIDKYLRKAVASGNLFDDIFFRIDAGLVEASDEYIDLLKVAAASKAILQGEFGEVGGQILDEAIGKGSEKFLKAIGATSNATLVGALLASIKIVQESYATLQNEECLLGVDVAYYSFLETPQLRWDKSRTLPDGAVKYFIENFLFGGGADPNNGSRAINRQHLQCFIDNSMPESERIVVSELDATADDKAFLGWFERVFSVVTDTLGSAADRASGDNRLRLPVTVMLRDFNARLDLEEQAKEMAKLRRSQEFQTFEATIDAMQSAKLAEEWLCEKLNEKPDLQKFVGDWVPTAFADTPAWMAENPFPMPSELKFSVLGDGSINTKFDDGAGIYTYAGSIDADGLKVRFDGKGIDSDTNIWETIFDITATSDLSADELSGEFTGTIIQCDDDFENCNLVPFSGKWTAKRIN